MRPRAWTDPGSPPLAGLPLDGAGVDTVILLDIDGVLNVGVRDEDAGAALLLSDENASVARRMLDRGAQRPCNRQLRVAEKLGAIWHRALPQDERGTTYATLACQSPSLVSNVLVARLAALIRLAGKGTAVVLSSSWRKPAYAKHVQHLQKLLSAYLGAPFSFAGGTPQREEATAVERLRCIADFLKPLCAGASPAGKQPPRPLTVLVLDDFFISRPGFLSPWVSNGGVLSSLEEAERYVEDQVGGSREFRLKIVHTYDEWVTSCGKHVAVGCGLTAWHYREAAAFLDEQRRAVGNASPTSPGSSPIGRLVGRFLGQQPFGKVATEAPIQEPEPADPTPAAPADDSPGKAEREFLGPKLLNPLCAWPWLNYTFPATPGDRLGGPEPMPAIAAAQG